MAIPNKRKTFRAPEELVELLVSRGLVLGALPEWVVAFFKEANYYNVINGYNRLFLEEKEDNAQDDHYKPGSRFIDIYSLWQLDQELKNLYVLYLRTIEERIKAVIVNTFSSHHDYANYLSHDSFDTGASSGVSAVTGKRVTSLISKIQSEISKNLSRNNKPVVHFMETYGYIPPWVLMNILSFRLAVEFYQSMKPEERIVVASQYGLSDKQFQECVGLLATVRNICSHNECFYNATYKRSKALDSLVYVDEYAPCVSISKEYRLFDITILLSYFLRSSELRSLSDRVKDALDTANNIFTDSKAVSIGAIEQAMGYSFMFERVAFGKSRHPNDS